jgi:hypothetical protein
MAKRVKVISRAYDITCFDNRGCGIQEVSKPIDSFHALDIRPADAMKLKHNPQFQGLD